LASHGAQTVKNALRWAEYIVLDHTPFMSIRGEHH